MWKTQPVFSRANRNWTSRQIIRKCKFCLPLFNLALRGTKRNKWHSHMIIQLFKKVDLKLAEWGAATVVEGGRFSIHEKSDHFNILAKSVHKICAARTFSRKNNIGKFFPDRKFSNETIIQDIKNVILEEKATLYQDASKNYSIFDNFRVTGFRSEKPDTKLNSRLALH